ncbi:MAG: trypsin-like peptidase domain-containing protein [Planctomycetota bacterium]
MGSRVLLPSLAAAALLASCSTPGVDRDERPLDLAPDRLRCVVALFDRVQGYGSGVAVGDDLLLTAWHVAESLKDESGDLAFRSGWKLVHGTVVASDADADWALVRVDAPTWSAGDVATVAAGAERDEVHPGRELWIASYAGPFFEDHRVDPRRIAPVIRVLEVRGERGEFLGTGRDAALAGGSGGGVFVWDRSRDAFELVGTFVAQSKEERTLRLPFGIEVPLPTVRRTVFARAPAAAIQVLRAAGIERDEGDLP